MTGTQTAPGTVITNQAVLTYTDSSTGEAVEVVSNVAAIYVSALVKFSLHSQHNIAISAGKEVNLSHELSNDGNVADSYQFSVDAENLSGIRIVRDANRNGIAEPGEPVLSGTLHLAPSASVAITVSVPVPGDALPGELFEVRLEVTNATESVRSVVDTISVQSGLRLHLHKTSSVACHVSLFPSDAL